MKKLNLNLGSREMLTREQMKKICGGDIFICYALSGHGSEGINYPIEIWGANLTTCQAAQEQADFVLTLDNNWQIYPYGIDCECGY